MRLGKPAGITCAAAILLSCAALAAAQDSKTREQLFQAALAHYQAGQFREATAPLERLVRELPASFEVQELLGLVYAAQSEDAKANLHLAQAVKLKPGSAEARSNLAASYARLGQLDLAQNQFIKAAELDPENYDTNHNLGEIYIRRGNLAKAVPYLEKAQKIAPSSYDNGYDLALAYLITNRLAEARSSLQQLLKVKDTAELHNLLAQVEEKDGKFIAAANEYEIAAHMDPSESNLFDWGGELLVHRTLDPAVQVFQDAIQRYPNSAKLQIGLGMAYYARGNYDDAVKALIHGADLNPADPTLYRFLFRAYNSSPGQAGEVTERFRRFAESQPGNARALYYYAMSLWKGKRAENPNSDVGEIESLLKKCIAADPAMADAYLQLGNLYSDQRQFEASLPEYEQALKLDPGLVDAHYRLGQSYARTGKTQLAQEQFAVYQKLREQHLAELDKERAEIRQFVYSEKDADTRKP